jgi:hypothetical protein
MRQQASASDVSADGIIQPIEGGWLLALSLLLGAAYHAAAE